MLTVFLVMEIRALQLHLDVSQPDVIPSVSTSNVYQLQPLRTVRLYSQRRVPYPISTINTWEAMRIFWILDMGYRIWDTGYGLWIRSKEPKFN